MSEAAWLTLAVSIAGTFGVIIAAIIKVPFRRNGTGVNVPDPRNSTVINVPDPKKCLAHSGIVAEIKTLRDGLKRIEENQKEMWDGIDEMRRDIKELIQRD